MTGCFWDASSATGIRESDEKQPWIEKYLSFPLTTNGEMKKCLNCILCLTLQAALQDSQVELETYKQTRQGLDEMYNVVWKQYKEEKRIRQVEYQQAVV